MEEMKEYHDDGLLYRHYFVDNNGIKQGSYKHYYISGELYSSFYLKNNLMRGVRYNYFINGNLHVIDTLKKGSNNGIKIVQDLKYL